MSIIYGCKDETKWYLVAGAGATTAYLGACTFSIPAMCIGTLVTSGGQARRQHAGRADRRWVVVEVAVQGRQAGSKPGAAQGEPAGWEQAHCPAVC